jgi:streptogramin lyase
LLLLAYPQSQPPRAATATITARSATSAQNGIASALSVATPATTQPGDLLLALVDVQYQPQISAPTGWQLVRRDVSPAGNHLEQAVYVHVAGPSEPASFTWTLSAAHGATGGIIDYAGVDPTTPVEASGAAFTTNQLAVTAPSLTTTVPNSLQLALFGIQGDHTIALPSSLAPELAVAIGGVAGEKLASAAGDRVVTAAGATGTAAATVNLASTGIGQSIALMPATVSGPPGTNQPPVVDTVAVSPPSPLTNDVVRAAVTAHDPDGDPIAFTYQWALNGVDLPGATGATLDLSQPGDGDRGDLIAVRVTASDGQATSAPVTSPPITVADSPPTAAVILSPTVPAPTSIVTATAQTSDADGDPVSLTYVWTVNGAVVRTVTTVAQSDSLDLSTACTCTAGDRVGVQVTPNDGTVDGSAATATAGVATTTFATVSEFALAPMSTPGNLTSGPDGNIWFTEENKPDVGRLALSTGTTTLFPVPSGTTGLGGITTGPDNDLWFLETQAAKVGRLVPSTGTITESAAAAAGGIVAGSDGNLWVFASSSNKILVISTAGKVLRTLTVPTASSYPHGPSRGADGNVYFVEFNGNKIGRVTPKGAFTEWRLPHAGSKPFSTAFGPDGRLYVTENAGNRIARLDPASGGIAEFALPTANAAPAGIAAGSDGNLWFAEKNADKLGRVTTSGAITEFPLPTPSAGPDKVTEGSDGNIWFTEHTADRIAEFSLH